MIAWNAPKLRNMEKHVLHVMRSVAPAVEKGTSRMTRSSAGSCVRVMNTGVGMSRTAVKSVRVRGEAGQSVFSVRI